MTTKEKIGAGLSVILFFFIYGLITTALHSVGIATEFYAPDGHMGFKTNVIGSPDGSESNLFAAGFFVTSGMFAWRFYRWFITGKLQGNISSAQQWAWNHWLFASTIWIAVAIIISELNFLPLFIEGLLNIFMAFGIWYIYFITGRTDYVEFKKKEITRKAKDKS